MIEQSSRDRKKWSTIQQLKQPKVSDNNIKSNRKNAVFSEQGPSLLRSLSQPGEHIKLDCDNNTVKQIDDLHLQTNWKKIKRLALKRLHTYTGKVEECQRQEELDDNDFDFAGLALNRRLEYNQLPGVIFAMMAQRDENGLPRIPVLLSLIKVQIIGVDNVKTRDTKLSRKVRQLRIVVTYGNTQWIIYRRYWDFVKLHYSYYGYDLTHTRRPPGLPVFPSMAHHHSHIRKHHHHDAGYRARPALPRQSQSLVEQPPNRQSSSPSLRAYLYSIGDQPITTAHAIQQEVNNYHSYNEQGPKIPLTTPVTPSSSLADADSFIDHHHPHEQSHQQLDSHTLDSNENGPSQHDKLLEQYMGQLIRATLHTGNINRLCKFLEISTLGLHLKATQPQGNHGKEGYMTIVGRTDRGPKHSRRWRGFCFGSKSSNSTDNNKLKWFIVRENYIVCVNHPHEMEYYDVLLFEPGLQVQRGYAHRSMNKMERLKFAITSAAKLSMGHSTLCVRTNAGEIYLRAKNARQATQFEQSLLHACSQSTWCLPPQRFNSFAPIRSECPATWFVDGKDYFYQISVALENAKKYIYIHDWWLSPEMYLRRPPSENEEWRLDKVLKRKAEQGVKIYIIVYKEVAMAVPLFSHHTKRHLLSLSTNIFVQRHPSRTLDILSKQETLFYAHHEKICLVDGVVAFIGGLDLCYGRYDTAQHRLTDDPSTVAQQNWIGKDYSNPRVDDFHALDKPFEDNIDRSSLPRMPWHDISVRLCGEAVRDIEHHFVQRWNFLRRRKSSVPKRATPMLIPSAFDYKIGTDDPRIGCTHSSLHTQVQILRSISSWSSGVKTTEHSIMDAYVELISTSKHFVYIENQFFITSTRCGTTVIENKIGDALYNRILLAHQEKENWNAVIILPMVPEFPGELDSADGTTIRLIMNSQYLSIGRGPDSLLGRLRAAGVTNTSKYINFYGLRAWGELNGSYVTEQVYIHAKTMIVDDQTTIIGSANINERSMLGVRDSEICACIEDTEKIDSTFGGQSVKVGRFAHSLRLRLMGEHLGLPVDDWDIDKLLHHAKLDKETTRKRKDLQQTSHELRELDREAASFQHQQTRILDQKINEELTEFSHPFVSETTTTTIDQIDSGIDDTGSSFTPTATIPDTATTTTQPTNIYSMSEETASLYKEWALWDTDIDNNGDASTNHVPLTLPLKLISPDKKGTDDTKMDTTDFPALTFCDDDGDNHDDDADDDDDIVFANLCDPLLETTQNMWHTRARYNTDLFRRSFMVLPDNNVRTWPEYSAFTKMARQLLGVKQGSKSSFMVPFLPYLLDRIKGHLVIWPIGFMEDEGENFVFAMDKLAPLEIFD